MQSSVVEGSSGGSWALTRAVEAIARERRVEKYIFEIDCADECCGVGVIAAYFTTSLYLSLDPTT